ncbi:MAG TPA: TorF family putative porin, partial [Burkholderiales bacterium]|nr:TorF family putative porin [Burkholderiales bacterium]
MSKKLLAAAAMAAALATPAVTLAQAPAEPASPHTLTANVGVYSQYIFRGLTQTNEDPALQGGFDYSYALSSAPTTFYLGAWGSNISWLKENFSSIANGTQGQYSEGGSLELDVYGGFKGNFGASDFTYDVGLLYYWYPGNAAGVLAGGSPCAIGFSGCPKANTFEAYGALGWKWLSVKYSYGLLNNNFGWPDSNEWYLDFSVAYPVGESGVTLGAHYGIQNYSGNVPGTLVDYDDLLSYDDWRISVAYDLGKASKVLSG